jgi:hypothetical protein
MRLDPHTQRARADRRDGRKHGGVRR